MRITSFRRIFFAALFLLTASAQAGPLTALPHKLTAAMSDLPRDEKLPLFNPHRKTFTCVYQDQQVPPLDPQAELWFQQALALDTPDIYYANRDYSRYDLMRRGAAVQKQIADIGRMRPPTTPAALHVKPLHVKPLHLKALLKNEIAAGVIEDAHHSTVTFRGDAMFPPGGTEVKRAMAPLITKIASEIAKVPGKVTVLGYTDSAPIRSGQFASNESLSAERATQVLQMLQAAGVPASHLEAIGKGDANPLGNNRTVQGRAQNRRVEITIEQSLP